jgi:hypothetical protein
MPQHSAEPTRESKLDVSNFMHKKPFKKLFKFPRAENRVLYKDILIS